LAVQNSVIALRRYPVKSMGGEALDVAEVDARGLAGDRWYAVEDGDGRFASGKSTRRFRRRDPVFDFSAATDAEGGVVVSRGGTSWRVGDPRLDQRLSDELGTAVRVTPESDEPHQDGGAVSIVGTATLRWCAARWDGSPDPRRFRVNVVVDTAEPFVEERWVGHELDLGSARLRVVERVPRCRTIDIRQDGADPGAQWLTALTQEREMSLAVYADVVRPGRIAVGDPARPV
jgi:uncharacterized protein